LKYSVNEEVGVMLFAGTDFRLLSGLVGALRLVPPSVAVAAAAMPLSCWSAVDTCSPYVKHHTSTPLTVNVNLPAGSGGGVVLPASPSSASADAASADATPMLSATRLGLPNVVDGAELPSFSCRSSWIA
jgi:hypothetical protein